MPSLFRTLAPWCLALLCCWAGAAMADEAAEVSAMLRNGQSAEAIARADRFLATKPRDPAMRFVRGVALMDAKRDDEALEAFTTLTQEFPNLAEPYNNLGVLLSRKGRYDEAREALQSAIRNKPEFAVAQENLGDVYAALAAQAYARSAQLDPAGAASPRKLAVIRQLLARPAS